jgi:ABC-2 type transport system ATP-binding protein
MTYFGRLKGLSKTAARTWSLDYLKRVALADKATARLDKLSGGQQQEVQLGVTIMNDPELLILDEPTKGFDPVNWRLLMDIVEEQKLAGATVIMVTHQMEEVEWLCDRVILLKDGTARAYGTVAEVQEQFGGTVYRVSYEGILPACALYDVVTDTLAGGPSSPRGPGANEATVLRELVEAGVAVRSLTATRVSLEEIFIQVYDEQQMAEVYAMAFNQHNLAPSSGLNHADHQEEGLRGRHPRDPRRPGDRFRPDLRVQLQYRGQR